MEHSKTDSDSPSLCINNCGFFGTSSMMNMCSKCHRDFMFHQEKAKVAEPSITTTTTTTVTVTDSTTTTTTTTVTDNEPATSNTCSNRCNTCRKRVGLTGFNCRCGNTFCSIHRYSDKHECPFDYRTAAKDAIASANPVVKAHKLDKI